MQQVNLDQSNIGQIDIDSVIASLSQGRVSTAANITSDFEDRMAGYLGIGDCLATNSGTAALHLALLAAGVGPGDEVILPVLTFVATANVVRYVGARPVFVDVDPRTWCMSVKEFENAITRKTKAVIPVHLCGVPADMSRIKYICRERDIACIEDAAESLGSTLKFWGEWKHAGTVGDYGCVSFNGNKIMTTGGGGLFVGGNIPYIRNMAQQAKGKNNDFLSIGYNYRMPSLNAALGLGQLYRLANFISAKRRFHEIYEEELSGLVVFQEATRKTEPNWWYTAGLLPTGIEIEHFQEQLQSKGIPTRRIFRPLSQTIAHWQAKRFPVAEEIYRRGLCLPGSTLNAATEIQKACEVIKTCI